MKTILIASLGGTPQVVTETIWGLMNPDRLIDPRHRNRAPSAPDVVHMIGTSFVADREAETRERISTLYRHCGYAPLAAESVLFDIVVDGDEAPIKDIRTERENNLYSRHVTSVVQAYAQQEDSRIHLSLAGGRKTMSSYDQSAMMFFGRIDDELSHVLVEPLALENHREFWWPGQPEAVLTARQRLPDGALGEEIEISTDVDAARIDLVSVPFVRLNARLDGETPVEALDPEELVRQVQSALDADTLTVDFATRALHIGAEKPVILSEQHFTLFAMLAFAKRDGWAGAGPNGVGGNHFGWVSREQYLDKDGSVVDLLCEIALAVTSDEKLRKDKTIIRRRDLLKNTWLGYILDPESDVPEDPAASQLSRLTKAINRKVENPHLKRLLLPDRKRQKNFESRIGLTLPADRIRIVNAPRSVIDALPGKV